MRKRTSKKIYKCVEQTTSKYTNRPSPPYPARECPNKIMNGNDGRKYISLGDYTGVYKWLVYSKEMIDRRAEKEQVLIEKFKAFKEKKNSKKPTKKRMRTKKLSKK